jgi:hypothetical protein
MAKQLKLKFRETPQEFLDPCDPKHFRKGSNAYHTAVCIKEIKELQEADPNANVDSIIAILKKLLIEADQLGPTATLKRQQQRRR